MQIHTLDEGRHIHMESEPDDVVRPCPFCGSRELELHNTHTAAYWVECQNCEAEVYGEAYGIDRQSNTLTMRHHALAKKSALEAWNRRHSAPDDAQKRKSSFRVTTTDQGVRFSIDHQSFTIQVDDDPEQPKMERYR